MRTISDEHLLVYHLGEAAPAERERIAQALLEDGEVRARYDSLVAHWDLYDAYPADAAAPAWRGPFAAGADAHPGGEPTARPLALARPTWRPLAAAAAVLVILGVLWALVGRGTNTRPVGPTAPSEGTMVVHVGPGLEIVDGDRSIPASAREVRRVLAHGARVIAERPTTLRIEGRARVVLDGGSSLDLLQPDSVGLVGRAHFEVEPGAFDVSTTLGRVAVLGTTFLVDTRGPTLAVDVLEGRVRAAGTELAPGEALREGRTVAVDPRTDDWFRLPRFEVRLASDASPRPGEALRLTLAFDNRTHLPITMPAARSTGTPLLLELWREGEEATRLPIALREDTIEQGGAFLVPGRPFALEAGARRTLGVRVRSPIRAPGAWRLRVWYQAEDGQPRVPSDVLAFEVTR